MFTNATVENRAQYDFIQSARGSATLGLGSITFAVTGLTTGATYDVSFYGALRAGYEADPIELLFNSAALGTFSPASSNAFDSFTTGVFTARASSGSLEFSGTRLSGDVDTALDKVVIHQLSAPPVIVGSGTVPEPGSIALVTLGMFSGLIVRRRLKAAQHVG